MIDIYIPLTISLGTFIGMQHHQLEHAMQVDTTDSCIFLLAKFSRTSESTTIYKKFAVSPSEFHAAVITAVIEKKLPIISTMLTLSCSYHIANYLSKDHDMLLLRISLLQQCLFPYIYTKSWSTAVRADIWIVTNE